MIEQLQNFVRQIRERGLEFTSGRYYSKYMGIVTDNNDPQGQGRVKVTCEVATGRSDELSLWARPCAEYAGLDKGIYFPPDIGDAVWVWFDHGDRTQPRYSGAMWANPNVAKSPDTSEVPSEFRILVGLGPVTTRGIKTKRGHGIRFEDDPEKLLGVEFWSGEQIDLNRAATKHHRIRLIDRAGDEHVAISSFGGHESKWIDIVGQEAITHETTKGLFIRLLDAQQKIEAGGPLGFKITIDETLGNITLETPTGKKIKIDETGQQILIDDAAGNTVTLSPAGIAANAAAAVTVQAAAEVSVQAAAAATVVAGGPVAVTGVGVAVESTGGAPSSEIASGPTTNTFIGLKTETLLGGLFQTLIGLWQVVGVIIDISGVAIDIGSPGTKFLLVDSRFIDFFNNHTHTSAAPGSPTTAPNALAAIGLQTTQTVAAN